MNKQILNLSLTIGVLLFVLAAKSQSIPGYLGSRTAIGYTLQFVPNFLPGNYNSSNADENAVEGTSKQKFFNGFSTVHFINVEYVLSKRTSIISNTGFSRAYYIPPGLESYRDVFYESRPGLTSIPIIFGYRWYSKKLAPIGTFFELNAGYQIINPDDFSYSGNFTNTSSTNGSVFASETITPDITGAFLTGLKFGRSNVFFDKLKVDFYGGFSLQYRGIGKSYTLLGYSVDDYTSDTRNENPYLAGNVKDTQERFEAKARGRMFGSFWGFTGLSFSILP